MDRIYAHGLFLLKLISTHAAMVAVGSVLIGAQPAWAANGTWSGTQDSTWVNSANWSASPYPGQGETATFDSAGNSHTNLTISGLFSVANIIFTGPSVAAYTIGTGPRDSQLLVMGTEGEYRIDASAANGQTFNCSLQLGGGSFGGNYTFRNDAPEQLLTLGSVFVPAASSNGTKTVRLRGAGAITVLGDMLRGPSGLNLNMATTNVLTLSGSNALTAVYLDGTNGIVQLNAGSAVVFANAGGDNIIASQNATINGPGSITLSTNTGYDHGNNAAASGKTLTINARLTGSAGFEYSHSSYDGTIALNGANDFAGSMVFNASGTIQCAGIGNKGEAGNLGAGTNILFNAVGSRLLYTGAGETTDRILNVQSGGILEHAGSGPLIFSASTASTTSGSKTLVVRNYAAATGGFSGSVQNGSGTVSLTKEGDGTWSLTAANTFSGSLDVEAGTLKLSGSDGAAASATACTVSNGATLLLDNTAAANNTDRLNDAGTVTLLNGTLDFNHDAGTADFSESAGALTAASGACTVQTDPAADGQTSALTFSSLSRLNGATLNFTGTGLGASDRNRIFITSQPEGPLVAWVRLNGQPAYYSVTAGVTAPSWSVTEIAARGPSSVIPDNAADDVRITQPGTSGPITLAGDPLNSVAWLSQCIDTAAEVDTANKTLLAYSVGITNGQAALTLGLSVGDGAVSPLMPGGILELNNASGSALTVNAALADNTTASSVAKFGTGNALVAGPTLHTGATEIHGGTLTFAGHDVTQRLAGAVSGGGTLVKTGTNLLDLAAANSGFTGPALLQQGITRVSQNGALGTADGGTVISDGATLDLGGAAADALNLQQEPVTVTGAGSDGQGAIINRSALQQTNALGKVELTGDTTFGGTARWDIRNGVFNMNNHSVTKIGASALGLSGTETVTPGGDSASIDVQEGSLRLQQALQMGGSAANTVRLRSGTLLDFYDLAAYPAWGLICEDNTTYSASHSTSDLHNRWAGPVTLNGALTLTFGTDSNYRSGFAGDVTGSGSLLVTNSTGYQPRFYLTGTNNTYSGPNRIVGGWIYARSIRNVGEPCSLGQPMTVADGTISLGAGTDRPGRLGYTGTGDTFDRVIDLVGRSSVGAWGTISHEGTGPLVISNVTFSTTGSKRLALFGTSTSTAEIVSAIVNSSDSTTEITKDQSGTWILSGNNTYSGPTTINGGGTLVFSGSNTLAGTMNVITGVLKIAAGAFMSSSANFGIRNNGAFYLDGGTFIRNTPEPDGETFSIGHSAGGYGHLLVNSGALTCTRLYAGWSGIGTTRFVGGNATFNHHVHVGRTSYGTLTIMPGGSVSQPVTAADDDCYIGFEGGRGEVNLLGGTYLQARGKFQAGANSDAATSIVNLCEGVLTTRNFFYAKGVLLVNFTGGTLKYPDIDAGATPLIPLNASVQAFTYGPRDGFAGGAVIDTNGRDCSLPAALRAPAGQGVTAIVVGSSGSGYIGEPYVKIAGDGYGACAVANMEDDGRGRGTYRVAGVTVTCPGVNYTTAPTVTFLGGGANIVTALAGTVTLAANTGGGLTKSGAGTLTLSGANTYTGSTTVTAGTLKLGNATALPTDTPVVLAGGTLDLNGATVTNALSGSGTLTNGTAEAVLSPAGAGTVGTNALTLSVAALRGTYQADVTAAGACDLVAITGDIDLSDFTLEIVDPLALNRPKLYTLLTCTGTRSGAFADTNLPQGWRASYQTPGVVKLVYASGTLLRVH